MTPNLVYGRIVRSGREEGLPYSLSRWTDVCGTPAKWAWVQNALQQQRMMAIDPRSGVPCEWSLKPEDTLGLIFWTREPRMLLTDAPWLKDYRFHVHITVTGWHEVEHKAPNLRMGKVGLYAAVKELGPENVTWRFSPVPLVPDAAERFDEIAEMAAEAGLKRVYLSFLQPNDRMPETRSIRERIDLLLRIAEKAQSYPLQVHLCAEDRLLDGEGLPQNLSAGICAPPETFELPGNPSPKEGCGCALAADPFTINETCSFGCEFCYAADKSLAPKKRNTTRSLPVVR